VTTSFAFKNISGYGRGDVFILQYTVKLDNMDADVNGQFRLTPTGPGRS
jgi:hypothetical protein